MIYIGPLVLGFLLGFILGSRIKMDSESKLRFTISSYLVVFVVAIAVAWQIGPFPYYNDAPFASGLLSAIIGILAGKVIFGRK
jgi:energy-converting hydrogenase B subunit J